MKKVWFFLLVFLWSFLANPPRVLAGFDKINEPNNKFGIHLAQASDDDLGGTAALVNSAGGDWGYVTVVMEETDRSWEKWQNAFNQMRSLHLIPIVRLATSFQNGNWRKPQAEEARDWVNFLDSLNWVTKNRYIILFNEPNYAKEWGGRVDPEDYGRVILEFNRVFKEKNQDFFLIPAGFNPSAPHRLPEYEREDLFLKKMFGVKGSANLFLQDFDGWASHVYEFSNYQRELDLLKNLGLAKNLPLFITEVGWPHAEGLAYDFRLPSEQKVVKNYLSFFNQVVHDPKVVTATPFVLNYQGEPFDHFSWRKPYGSQDYYSVYGEIQKMTKTKGSPNQDQKIEIESVLPKKLITGSTYAIPLKVNNLGQAIWSQAEGYRLVLVGVTEEFAAFFSNFSYLLPFNEETIWLYFKTSEEVGQYNFSLAVDKESQQRSNLITWDFEIVPKIKIDLDASFVFQKAQGSDFKLLIYNSQEEVVFEKSAVNIEKGQGRVEEVTNLEIGETYRVVLLKPYYLPRQEFLIVKEDDNRVGFKPLLPLDFNLDGKLSWQDLWVLIKSPKFSKR